MTKATISTPAHYDQWTSKPFDLSACLPLGQNRLTESNLVGFVRTEEVAVTAPPVEGNHWLTTRPVPWESLRGQVVVVVFWSIGCEASLAMLNTATKISDAAGERTTLLAVHTPRFPYADDVAEVQASIAKYKLQVAAVHDPEFLTWNRYNPGGWPATLVIDHRGKVLGAQLGLCDSEVLEQNIALANSAAGQANKYQHDLQTELPDLSALASQTGNSVNDLCFPSGLTAISSDPDLIAVSDRGRDCVIILKLHKSRLTAETSLEIEHTQHVQSICSNPNGLLYATQPDLGQVLKIDSTTGDAEVILEELERPCGITCDLEGSLVITDSADNLIYRFIDEPNNRQLGVIAGNGTTGNEDGPAALAELAQPVAVTRTNVGLVFCDAASNNARLLTDTGRVMSLTNNDFYEFGLADGPAHQALLQRPTAVVALADNSLIIADTGNNRLRRMADRKLRTLGLAGLSRPEALAILPDGFVIVADTNNHRIVMIPPSLDQAWALRLVADR